MATPEDVRFAAEIMEEGKRRFEARFAEIRDGIGDMGEIDPEIRATALRCAEIGYLIGWHDGNQHFCEVATASIEATNSRRTH